MTKYRINLMPDERHQLIEWVKNGKRAAKHIQYAQILLASDEQIVRQSELFIAAHYHISVKTVERVRKNFCQQGRHGDF